METPLNLRFLCCVGLRVPPIQILHVMKKNCIYSKLVVVLIGLSFSYSNTLKAEIKYHLFNRINLKPSCDTFEVSYIKGVPFDVQAINQPFKRRESFYESFYGYHLVWVTHHHGGPKYEMLQGISQAKAKYSLEVTSASAGFSTCVNNALSSFLTNATWCYSDWIFQGRDKYDNCMEE